MPESEELIALRGSTEESIKAIEDKIKEIDQKKLDKASEDEDVEDTTEDTQIDEEKQKLIKAKEKFLKEKEAFSKEQKATLLEPFSKEEREAYKDLTIKELALITKDRKMKKDNLFLTDPEPTPKPQDLIVIGWGKPYNGIGYGWYNAKGEILSTDRDSPYGVKK